MPTDAEPLLVDTSVAVALVVTDHDHHRTTSAALAGTSLGLAGHAAFETYSVLSRLPPPARRTPAVVQRLLHASFPATRFLGSRAAAALQRRLAEEGIAGGAVYDALVAAAALEHELTLVTRDRRASATYRTIGATVRLLS